MILNNPASTLALCILVAAFMGPDRSLAADNTLDASPTSTDSAALVSLAPAYATASVPFAVRDTAWLQRSNLDSIVLMFPSNDKKEKKNKHDDQDEGNWDNDRKSPEHDREGGTRAVSVQVAFGERDRQVIREYCAQPSSNLPPGLAKRGGQLPPGLEKHLRRNGQLPPGLQKKVERFPKELERRLPPLPSNYVRVFVGGRGLIVDAQFNIVDIIDMFR